MPAMVGYLNHWATAASAFTVRERERERIPMSDDIPPAFQNFDELSRNSQTISFPLWQPNGQGHGFEASLHRVRA
ncbi:hypothetical protein TNCV_416201 [Trichonephila clavipes]|nr:hypothetical protein TNCV_416201 [Trichonephila clavipes]